MSDLSLEQQDVYTRPGSPLCVSTHAGSTLIEIMVAITIGAILFSVLMGIYLTSSKSMQMQSALYETEDNARMAISVLTSEIHKAGNIGCAKLTQDFPLFPYYSYSLGPNNKIVSKNSNEIEIRYIAFPNAVLQQTMTDHTHLLVDKKIAFSKGEILVISNCKQAEIFAVQEIRQRNHLQQVKAQAPLHAYYEKNAEVGPLVIEHFYVAKTKRKNPDGAPVYALYLKDIDGRTSELVAGIKWIQLSYTIRREGKLMDVAPAEVRDWSSVVGANVDLELSSPFVQKTWHMFAVIQ